MPGPSRYNRKLKAKNDRKAARASRGGRTPSEAGLARSMKASGKAVSKTNLKATAPSTYEQGREVRRARRRGARLSQAKPPELPGLLGDLQDAISGLDRKATRTVSRELNKAPKVDFIPPAAEKALDKALGNDDGEFTYAERLINAPIVGGAGLTAARTAGGAGKVVAKVVAKETGEQAAKKGVKETAKKTVKQVVTKTKKAPKRTAKRIKNLKTPEGRAGAANRVATTPARRPVPSTAAYTVAAQEAGLDGEAVKRGSALVKGTVAAPFRDPEQYLETTGRGIAGIGVAFGKGAYALGNTAVRGERAIADELGVPVIGKDYSAGEVVAPVTDLAKQEYEGTKALGSKLLSGDQAKIEQAYIDELGALPFLPVPFIARKVKGTKGYRKARTGLRERSSRKVKQQREQARPEGEGKRPQADRRGRDKPVKKPREPIRDPLTGEEYAISNLPVVRQLGGRAVAGKLRNRNIRKGIANLADVESQIVARETVLDDADVQAAIGGIRVAPRAGRNTFLTRAEEAAFVVANRGIPFERDRALGWMNEIEQSKTPAPYRVGGVRESRVFDWIRQNPEVLGDPAFQRAVKRVGGILEPLTTSRRAQFLPVAKVAGIRTPEERLAEGISIGGSSAKLSREEGEVIAAWAEEGLNSEIGSALRSGRNSGKAAQLLSATAKQQPTGQPMTLYRRVQLDKPLDSDLELLDPQVSGVGKTRTFLSTTKAGFSPEAAQNFEVAVIRLPAGSKVLDVEANLGRNPFSESEVILPPGTVLRWVDETADGNLIYDANTPDLPTPSGRLVKEAVTDPRKWEEWRATLRKRRSELREAKALDDGETAAALRIEIKRLERRISDAQVGYKRAERDYLEETQRFIDERGLRTPARLTDKETPATEGLKRFGLSGRGSQRRTSRTPQKTEGTNLARDVADRSRSANWTQSILDPRLQRVFHSLTKTVVANYGYKITLPTKRGRGRQVLEATTRELQRALDRGELPDNVVLVDAQYYRGAIGDKNAGIYNFNDFLDAISGVAGRSRTSDTPESDGLPPVLDGTELRRLGREDRAADPGKKYIAIDREAVKELFGQVEGVTGRWSRGFAKANRGVSNVILGWNPSFPLAQQVAEGGPATVSAATGNPAAIARMVSAAPNRKRGTNKQQAQREVMYGIAGGTYQFRQPSRNATVTQVDQLTDPRFTLSAKTKGLGYDAVRGRAINDLVLWTGAKYRRMAGLAELDRRAKRAVGGLGNLVSRYGSLQKKFKGKSLAEVEDYFAANPKLRAEIRGYLNDVMGNWTTLTRLEARYAPGIAFYPYVRYSLKWAFYSYPRRHPVRASILYFLGQVNAEELEKLVGNGKVADWIDFAYPVVSKGGLPYVLPGGARFAPSASGVVESLPLIGDDNPEKALGSINPAVKVILDASFGRESFQGEKVANTWLERVLLGAAGFLSMAAPIRAADEAGLATPITSIKPRRTWDGTVIGNKSGTAKEFDRLDPNRIERGFSIAGPLIGQSAKDYRKTNRKARQIERGDYSTGSSGGGNPFIGSSSSSSTTNGNPFK